MSSNKRLAIDLICVGIILLVVGIGYLIFGQIYGFVFLITLIGIVFIVIGYLILNPPKEKKLSSDLNPQEIMCPICKIIVDRENAVCPKCGRKLWYFKKIIVKFINNIKSIKWCGN